VLSVRHIERGEVSRYALNDNVLLACIVILQAMNILFVR
jgi:hypothetical protein